MSNYSNSEKKKNFFKKNLDSAMSWRHSSFDESFGLKKGEWKKASGWRHARRAAVFATAGSGIKRELIYNSIGQLTNQQKAMAAKGGLMTKAFINMIPLASMYGAIDTLASGGGIGDYLADWTLPGLGMIAGYRAGSSAGMAAASISGAKTRFMGAAIGGGAGAVTGMALAIGVGEVMRNSKDSNNMIKQIEESMHMNSMKNDFIVTQNTLTNRQRAMSQLRNSHINDRAAILGNEASLISGSL